MNRRNILAGAGFVAASSLLPAASALPSMPAPPFMPNRIRFVMPTKTQVGRNLLLCCICDRDGVDVAYPAPAVVRSVTAEGRKYIWSIATDAPPGDVLGFFDREHGPKKATSHEISGKGAADRRRRPAAGWSCRVTRPRTRRQHPSLGRCPERADHLYHAAKSISDSAFEQARHSGRRGVSDGTINRRRTLVLLGAAAASALLPAPTPFEVGKYVVLAATTRDGGRLLHLAEIVSAVLRDDGWRCEVELSPMTHAGHMPDDLWNRLVAQGETVDFEPGKRGGFVSRHKGRIERR